MTNEITADEQRLANTQDEVYEILLSTFGPAKIDGEPQFDTKDQARDFVTKALDRWLRTEA